MSLSQTFLVLAAIYMAPHLSRRAGIVFSAMCLAWSVIGPFIMEWMSK
ncbi:hypothetical protein [Variovorax ginsengisoli]|uniref:MFS transporter n=1 Tax=Variovorax ginsengisoli TaxID=363844 RepID=A0ABT8RZ42_9BURK|nr:hypothetical protein [Variovorax ginsengisoli]MDN8612770.1 hypothetical protein [Variovorax ginsengisoli]MDO1531940.1 hypothetical protein [Variovorax ginsengisoli]